MKCEHCGEDKHIVDLTNYTIIFRSVVSYNCCTKEEAILQAKRDYCLSDEDIIEVE